jgi:CDP-diacylglycerol--glycerol-3-phosphate 3-phosphatidyltransferase
VKFESGKVWTLSNLLSILRIVLILPIILLLESDLTYGKYYGIGLLFVAMFTDYLDGYFARSRNEISELGKILDPLADKIAIAAAAIYLYIAYAFPLWLLVVILVRDAAILFGSILLVKKMDSVVPANQFGKWTTTIISALILAYIFDVELLKLPLEIAAAVFLAISSVSYLRNYLQLSNQKVSK